MPTPPPIAFVATREFREFEEEWPLLEHCLTEAGLVGEVVRWDDASVCFDDFTAVLVNFAWGYVADCANFLAFADKAAERTLVLNPPAALRWNSAKTYLADLEQAGIAIIPTTFVPPGAPFSLPEDEFVIKPAISSGGIGAARYRRSAGEVAYAHVRRLHEAGQHVLIQPYQHRIDEAGETALFYFDGEYSHAITKRAPLLPDAGEPERLWERTTHVPASARPDQRLLAESALAEARRRCGSLCYARVDLVDDVDGRPQILEVEIIEPRLFLPGLDAARQMVAAISRRLDSSSRDGGT